MLHILNSQNTVLNKFVAEIRDKSIQKDSMRSAVIWSVSERSWPMKYRKRSSMR